MRFGASSSLKEMSWATFKECSYTSVCSALNWRDNCGLSWNGEMCTEQEELKAIAGLNSVSKTHEKLLAFSASQK